MPRVCSYLRLVVEFLKEVADKRRAFFALDRKEYPLINGAGVRFHLNAQYKTDLPPTHSGRPYPHLSLDFEAQPSGFARNGTRMPLGERWACNVHVEASMIPRT